MPRPGIQGQFWTVLTRPQAETPSKTRYSQRIRRLTRPKAEMPSHVLVSLPTKMAYPPEGGYTLIGHDFVDVNPGLPARRRRYHFELSLLLFSHRHTRPKAETPWRRMLGESPQRAYPPAGGDTGRTLLVSHSGIGIPAQRRRHPIPPRRPGAITRLTRPQAETPPPCQSHRRRRRHTRPQAETPNGTTTLADLLSAYPPAGGDTPVPVEVRP